MTSLVELHHVSKRYRLGRERLNLRMAVPGRWGEEVHGEIHAALDDVSIEVDEGESLGIVGPNGAGKSTLLKVVARVVGPSSGDVHVRGRTAALIELGAGFHPDMTGRENVHFAAAVLGMGRSAVRARFDEIVAFADIGAYLDTPVKRYSSGMMARLGFAVAAHLDANVVVIDEVLSVGDAAFQRRCHDRIGELRATGAAILFVTHNTWVVPLVCDRAMLLLDGRTAVEGDPATVLARYTSRGASVRTMAGGTDLAAISSVAVTPAVIGPGDGLTVEIVVDVAQPMPDGHVLLGLAGSDGALEAGLSSRSGAVSFASPGTHRLRCEVEAVPLQPGPYSLFVIVLSDVAAPVVEDQHRVSFEVQGQLRDRPTYGVVALDATWHHDAAG